MPNIYVMEHHGGAVDLAGFCCSLFVHRVVSVFLVVVTGLASCGDSTEVCVSVRESPLPGLRDVLQVFVSYYKRS